MIEPRVLGAGVAVDPEREAALAQLGVAACGVGDEHVGLVNGPGPPSLAGGRALSGPTVPPLLLDDGAEILPEGLDAGPFGDRAVDRGGEGRQQIGLLRPGDHEGAIVGFALDVVPALGRRQLAEAGSERGHLLLERLPQDAGDVSHPGRPRPSAPRPERRAGRARSRRSAARRRAGGNAARNISRSWSMSCAASTIASIRAMISPMAGCASTARRSVSSSTADTPPKTASGAASSAWGAGRPGSGAPRLNSAETAFMGPSRPGAPGVGGSGGGGGAFAPRISSSGPGSARPKRSRISFTPTGSPRGTSFSRASASCLRSSCSGRAMRRRG